MGQGKFGLRVLTLLAQTHMRLKRLLQENLDFVIIHGTISEQRLDELFDRSRLAQAQKLRDNPHGDLLTPEQMARIQSRLKLLWKEDRDLAETRHLPIKQRDEENAKRRAALCAARRRDQGRMGLEDSDDEIEGLSPGAWGLASTPFIRVVSEVPVCSRASVSLDC